MDRIRNLKNIKNIKCKKESCKTQYKWIFCLVALLVFLLFSTGLLYQAYMENKFEIYQNTLRFHVRAASDEEEEQRLKLVVRDCVLDYLKAEVEQASDVDFLERILAQKTEEITAVANKAICGEGHTEKAVVFLTKERFPFRRYGTVVFPAGVYRALRVDIGPAKGHNWWCAIYPKLCYQSEDTFLLSGKGKKDIADRLSDKEEKLLAGKQIHFRFRLLECLLGDKS